MFEVVTGANFGNINHIILFIFMMITINIIYD